LFKEGNTALSSVDCSNFFKIIIRRRTGKVLSIFVVLYRSSKGLDENMIKVLAELTEYNWKNGNPFISIKPADWFQMRCFLRSEKDS